MRARPGLLAALLVLALGACDKKENPLPPRTPPRPTLEAGHFYTAQLQMSERPVRPPPGAM